MRGFSLFRISLAILILVALIGGIWFLANRRGSPPTDDVSRAQATTVLGILGQSGGIYSALDVASDELVYISNSYELAIMSALRPLVGQTVLLVGNRNGQSLELTSINNQILTSPVSPSPIPGLREVFANLPANQQQCLVTSLEPKVVTKLFTESTYQLTPAESVTLEMCLSQTRGGS